MYKPPLPNPLPQQKALEERGYLSYILIILISFLLSTHAWGAHNLKIKVTGITGEALKNVQMRLSQIETNDSQVFLQQAPEQIKQALQPFGYFKSEIHSKLINNSTEWYALFSIDPGPALKISQIQVDMIGPGKQNLQLQFFINHFPLKIGQTLKTEFYEKTKEQFFQIANNQGYLKAFLEKKEIQINLKKYTATIHLIFNTGPRYYFGKTTLTSEHYAPCFLKRFSRFYDWEPFSSEKLVKYEEDLRSSRYFQQVEVTPKFDNTEEYKVPILITATPPKSQRYDVGIGYGTFTGPRFTASADFRRVTPTGQRLTTQLKLSSVLSEINAKYFIPGNNPLTDQYTLGANVQQFSPKNGTSFSQTLSASYTKSLENWQNALTLSYLNERYRVENKPTHISQVFYPSWMISHIQADDLLFPRWGHMINFKIQAASADVLSKTNFFQTEIKGKYIFSPTCASRVLLRGDLGYTVVEDLNRLPLTLRYFAGGLGSVRGYPYDSIGPGRYLEVASVEYQHRVVGNWSGAVFYDVGNASDVFNGVFNHGTGIGVIYQSFVGPIQLYVGRALSKPGKPYSVEFSIGPDL